MARRCGGAVRRAGAGRVRADRAPAAALGGAENAAGGDVRHAGGAWGVSDKSSSGRCGRDVAGWMASCRAAFNGTDAARMARAASSVAARQPAGCGCDGAARGARLRAGDPAGGRAFAGAADPDGTVEAGGGAGRAADPHRPARRGSGDGGFAPRGGPACGVRSLRAACLEWGSCFIRIVGATGGAGRAGAGGRCGGNGAGGGGGAAGDAVRGAGADGSRPLARRVVRRRGAAAAFGRDRIRHAHVAGVPGPQAGILKAGGGRWRRSW